MDRDIPYVDRIRSIQQTTNYQTLSAGASCNTHNIPKSSKPSTSTVSSSVIGSPPNYYVPEDKILSSKSDVRRQLIQSTNAEAYNRDTQTQTMTDPASNIESTIAIPVLASTAALAASSSIVATDSFSSNSSIASESYNNDRTRGLDYYEDDEANASIGTDISNGVTVTHVNGMEFTIHVGKSPPVPSSKGKQSPTPTSPVNLNPGNNIHGILSSQGKRETRVSSKRSVVFAISEYSIIDRIDPYDQIAELISPHYENNLVGLSFYNPTCSVYPSRNICSEIICIMTEHRLTELYLNCKAFIIYPDLLEKYTRFATIKGDDLCCMICRCIEHGNEKWALESLYILIGYIEKGRMRNMSEPVITDLQLITKFDLNIDMYNMCRKIGLTDKCYDGDGKYLLPSLRDIDRNGSYVGYRVAWYLLCYGSGRRSELIDWWDIVDINNDETYQAAVDFFHLDAGDTDQETVVNLILELEIASIS